MILKSLLCPLFYLFKIQPVPDLPSLQPVPSCPLFKSQPVSYLP
jgi:hypothetical protein